MISKLNQSFNIYDIKDISIVKNGSKLAVRDADGITFWNLQKSFSNLKSHEVTMSFSPLMLSRDKQHLFLLEEENHCVKVDLMNNMKIEKGFIVNEDYYTSDFVGNGDLLLKELCYSDGYGEDEDEEKWRLVLVDFDQVNYTIEENIYLNQMSIIDSEDDQQEEKKSRKDLLPTSPKKFNLKRKNNRYVLFESFEEITNHHYVTNKGFKYPEVFMNNQIVDSPEFWDKYGHITHSELYVTTNKNKIFKIEFNFDEQKEICGTITKIFDNNTLSENKSKIPSVLELDNEIHSKQHQQDQSEISYDYKAFYETDFNVMLTGPNNKKTSDDIKISLINRNTKKIISKMVKFNQMKISVSVYFMKESNHSLWFYISNSKGAMVFQFHKKEEQITAQPFLEKFILEDVPIVYSNYTNMFLIAHNNSLQLWNESLTHIIHTFNFKKHVGQFYIIENDEDCILTVYDEINYYEIDLETLYIRKTISVFDNNESNVPLNIEQLPVNKKVIIPYFIEDVNGIEFLASPETLNLKEFPFETLSKCFNKEDYRESVKFFSKYYFNKIAGLKYEDDIYGPLNPIYFAIYHNDMGLLEDILDKERYPKFIKNYWSPLQYSFKFNYHSAVKFLCDRLSKRNYYVEFSEFDFKYLLNSKYAFCHRLLSSIPSEPVLQNFPRLMYMKRDVDLSYISNIGDMLINIKNKEIQINSKKMKKISKKQFVINFNNTENQSNESSKLEVFTKQVPFKYSYKFASPDSINFLMSYSESKSEEFIISDWKHLIKNKWRSQRALHICISLVYWIFTILNTVTIIFMPESKVLKFTTFIYIFVLMFYEVIEIISYSCISFSKYFSDIWNYLDWICYFLLIIYYLFYHSDPVPRNSNKIISALSLLLIYYRSFSYFRIIDAFTTLIGIINTIILKLIIFFFILFYLFFATGLVMIKLNNNQSKITNLQIAYVWTFFGGVEGSDFKEFDYSAITILFGTILVTIVLLNVLIAYLSNLFSRLEDQQHANDLREKASMMMDLEIVAYFFKYVMTGQSKNYFKYNHLKEKSIVFIYNKEENLKSVSPNSVILI